MKKTQSRKWWTMTCRNVEPTHLRTTSDRHMLASLVMSDQGTNLRFERRLAQFGLLYLVGAQPVSLAEKVA